MRAEVRFGDLFGDALVEVLFVLRRLLLDEDEVCEQLCVLRLQLRNLRMEGLSVCGRRGGGGNAKRVVVRRDAAGGA